MSGKKLPEADSDRNWRAAVWHSSAGEFVGSLYKWPDCSCVALVRLLNRKLNRDSPEADYSRFLAMSEARCLAWFRRRKYPALEYMAVHAQALAAVGWEMIEDPGPAALPCDVLIHEKAWGICERRGTRQWWRSHLEFPALLFVGANGRRYCWVEGFGLEETHYDGHFLTGFRCRVR